MSKICQSCSFENSDSASYCRDCGAALSATSDRGDGPSESACPHCDAAMAPEASFCRSCGAARNSAAASTGGKRALPPALLIAAGVGAIVLVAAVVAVFVLTSGGDDEPRPATPNSSATAETAPTVAAIDPATVSLIAGAVAGIPEATGNSDLEQMRSLLGPPEAFTIAMEVDDAGVSTRREEWFFYELRSVYEFVDGTLVSNLPIEAENPFLILPIQYDPRDFTLGISWDEVAAMLGGGAGIESFTLEPEYELDVTIYAGNQLLLMFDEDGLLIYLETIPLAPGESQ